MRTKKNIIAQLHSLSTRVYKFCRNKLQLPVVCILCNNYLTERNVICENCYELLPKLDYVCEICCSPLNNAEQAVCNECRDNRPSFNKVYSAFLYEEPLQTLIHNFKYHNALFLQKFLTDLLSEAVPPNITNSVIIPVPLSKQRLKQRGYNQAALIAKCLAKQIKVPYSDKYLQKTIHTPNQVELSKNQRKKNLINAFVCKKIKHKNVVLVDDIVTTGSTVNEISKILYMQGAENVDVYCIARAGNFMISK